VNAADAATALLRGAHLAALVSLFGTLIFAAVALGSLPAAGWARSVRTRLGRLLAASLSISLTLGIAWSVMQSAGIAGTSTLGETLAAVPVVAVHTWFGQLVLIRTGLLLALVPLCLRLLEPSATKRPDPTSTGLAGMARALGRRARLPTAAVVAGGALAVQALTSHFGALDAPAGRDMVALEALHILAAGAWLGALAPLLICLVAMPSSEAARCLRRFFPLGLLCVSVIAVTSLLQAVSLVGSVPALVGTAYGRVVLLKLLLFLSLLVFAALNRFVFAGPGRHLRRSILGEAAVAFLVMLAAGSLAHLTPGVHEQPVWPFAWRMNPDAAGQPFVRAYPTSFYTSPTGFAADAIVRGEHLFQAHCASCHGATGHGASTLAVAPPDLTAQRVAAYSDGDLFWLAGHAVATPDDARWDLVDYLRAHNRGEFVRTSGRGQVQVLTPRFDAVCADGRVIDRDDLRGKVLRIVVPGEREGAHPPADADAGLVTITFPAVSPARAEEPTCLAQHEAREAFAILLGTTTEALAGSELLIDANGWLRARWRVGTHGGWPTPGLLLARVKVLARSPLPADPASAQAHHH